MNTQVIPAAAIEAVLAALSEHVDASQCCALAVIDAVAPHMLAEAWDEGRKHGAIYPYGQRGLATDDNPYRSQP